MCTVSKIVNELLKVDTKNKIDIRTKVIPTNKVIGDTLAVINCCSSCMNKQLIMNFIR